MREEFDQKKLFVSLLFENMGELMIRVPENSIYRKSEFEDWKIPLANLAAWMEDPEGPQDYQDLCQENEELSEEELCNKIWECFETKVNVLSDLFKSYRNQTDERSKRVFLYEIINTINF